MIIADISLSGEAIAVIGALVTALAGAIAILFRMLVATHESRLMDMTSQRDSYKEMTEEAMVALEAKINELRANKGKPPIAIVAAVIPEHSSPTSVSQQDTADLQTMRARLTAATLELGLPPRLASIAEKDHSR